MTPIFWLGISFLLVASSLSVLLWVAVPAVQELARTARSAQRLLDMLSRELPPTLEAMRLTGLEVSELTDEMSESIRSAGSVVKQLDAGLQGVREQATNAQRTTRSLTAGVKAAWRSLHAAQPSTNNRSSSVPDSKDR
ncbi:hypothetical protein [Synechococcus elongatus]|uniref:DUF948 domain-containing protein n=2 Tax=Synechococcus elongatus TaxID=32046 RepID=Q31SD1_SYNE7|nr:hypothetical protein [Synechococcus elongatus]ABB56038.1 hypothetical protein Synpcc7942_0006 [Synechococcus elongatus PCC 7942 = FACHB-805]AJD56898.1 hypothetical protein M744_03075 [Synechococcus elongatus UTEX 2973]MBD2587870.1 hypothetical protein [Synechococcus elongatus FACHB-242]MBD2688938.1 hypothetical protein [Synechococcus elongatus FACHB-1061]MBD2707422.1 hypothetical protein [Synechococcus elongatus PCC 7942 = FACHB-805]